MKSSIRQETISNFFIPFCNVMMKPVLEYTLKFDGCCKGNPGPAGAGAVLYKNNNEIACVYRYVGDKATNNIAEYHGLIIGLEKARELGIKDLAVMGDSKLIIQQMKGEFKVSSQNIVGLHKTALSLSKLFDEITYEHIYRKDNVRADELANIGLQSKTIA